MGLEQSAAGYDAGFARSWDASTARRQLQTSLILIGALACSAIVLASTLRFDPPMQEGRSAIISHSEKSASITASYAGALVAVR